MPKSKSWTVKGYALRFNDLYLTEIINGPIVINYKFASNRPSDAIIFTHETALKLSHKLEAEVVTIME